MAIGDDAAAAGFPLVAETDLVNEGDDEINRTRDLLALVKASIPVGKSGYRAAAGITAGTDDPTGGSDGDLYFKYSA